MKILRNQKKSFTIASTILIVSLVVLGVVLWGQLQNNDSSELYIYPESEFGNYLAIKHAIWVDDFDSVINLSNRLKASGVSSVQVDVAIGRFLSGDFDYSAKVLSDEKTLPARIAYTTSLLKLDDWDKVYNLFSKDSSQILVPLRIWSAVAIGKESEALKIINKTNASESWKLFARGMVYAETKRPNKAKECFDQIPLEFFNLNDYLYLLGFYEQNGFNVAAQELFKDFSATPGGALIRSYKIRNIYSVGIKKALSFGLIQNVSHTPSMSYSGASLILMRLAQSLNSGDNDAINYHLGMYFYTSGSKEYLKCFSNINSDSVYYLFAMMKNAEIAGNFNKMRKNLKAILKKNPYFMPALQKLIAINLQKGRYNDALGTVNKILKFSDLSKNGSEKIKSHLLLMRARVYFAMGKFDKAQSDILKAGDLTPQNPNVLLDMAKLFAAKKENLDKAYLYTTAVIKDSPSNIDAWDTFSMVVWAKEGAFSASEILERVGRVANENSALFQHLGDVRAELGNKAGAIEAYQRALNLSEDGLSCGERCLKKKIRRLK